MRSRLRKIVLISSVFALLIGGGGMSMTQCEMQATRVIQVQRQKNHEPHLTQAEILRNVDQVVQTVRLRAFYRALAAQVPFCGGTAPPCWVCQRESHCTYGAFNPTGCSGRSCYGKWQFDPTTWDNEVRAMGRLDLVGNYFPADPKDQDRVAVFTWAGGRGCSNWDAC